jgi:hypothetical protein
MRYVLGIPPNLGAHLNEKTVRKLVALVPSYTIPNYSGQGPPYQGRILVEVVGEVEKNLGEVQRSNSRPPWEVRA